METHPFLSNGSSLTLGTSNATTLFNPSSYALNAPSSQSFNLIPQNTVMQNKVAVFKVTRDENNKITDTKFIKELWVETKNQSVEFQVARDKDLADYDANDLFIKTIHTVTF
jgi:hypothetical protein